MDTEILAIGLPTDLAARIIEIVKGKGIDVAWQQFNIYFTQKLWSEGKLIGNSILARNLKLDPPVVTMEQVANSVMTVIPYFAQNYPYSFGLIKTSLADVVGLVVDGLMATANKWSNQQKNYFRDYIVNATKGAIATADIVLVGLERKR